MSDNHDKLDDLFRSGFEDVELPVSDKLLANIKQELGIPKRKRRFGFWFASGVIIVAGIAGVVMFNFKGKENKKQDSSAVLEITEPVDGNSGNSNMVVKDNITTANSEPEKNTEENRQITEQAQDFASVNSKSSVESSKDPVANFVVEENRTEKSGQTKEKAKKKSNNDSEKNQEVKDEPLASRKSQTKIASKQQKETKKEKSKAVSPQGEPKGSESAVSNAVQEKPSEFMSKQPASGNANLTITETNKEESGKQVAEQNGSSTSDSKQQPQKDSLTIAKDTSAIAKTPMNPDTLQTQKKQEPEKKMPKSFSFFVELNGGPSQSFRKMSPDNNYIVMERGAEKPLFTYNVGCDVGILLKGKYQMATGLGIDTKGEQYSFQGQSETISYVLDSFYVYYDTIIDSTLYTDSVLTYSVDTQYTGLAAETAAKNRYQYFRIPVMFGYRFDVTEKWFITPNAGVIVNYLISANSTWFDAERQQLVTYNTRDKYRPLVLAGRVKIDIGYKVNNKWSVLVQPGYTRFLQSIYRKEDSFKHNPYSYDLNVAVRYTFQ